MQRSRNSSALALPTGRRAFPLSSGERAGVRGNRVPAVQRVQPSRTACKESESSAVGFGEQRHGVDDAQVQALMFGAVDELEQTAGIAIGHDADAG